VKIYSHVRARVCVCIRLCIAVNILFPGIVTYGFIMCQPSKQLLYTLLKGMHEDEVCGFIILDGMCMSAYHFLHVP